eukprot:104193_1
MAYLYLQCLLLAFLLFGEPAAAGCQLPGQSDIVFEAGQEAAGYYYEGGKFHLATVDHDPIYTCFVDCSDESVLTFNWPETLEECIKETENEKKRLEEAENEK